MKDKAQLERILNSKFKDIIFNQKYLDSCIDYIVKSHNIPGEILIEIVNGRRTMSNIPLLYLYAFAEAIDKLDGTSLTSSYFDDEEIKQYKKEKYQKEKFKFPIVIPCIPVKNDQWIGAVDARFFMELREAQLIRYNPDAQRVMKKVSRRKDGVETYQIAVNMKAVNEITEEMRNGSYLPDEITLNIPEDMDVKIDYVNGELIIDKLDYFDISDGYHRYLAMGRLYDEDENFNYPMEIRIVRYSTYKVKRFIYQKDQKTKMSKIDSSSMNMNSFSNIIAEQLNTEYGAGEFVLHGKINRSSGTINLPELSAIIDYFYKPSYYKKKYSVKEMAEIRNTIKIGLNRFFLEVYPGDIEHEKKAIDYKDLLIIMYIISNGLLNEDKKVLLDKYNKCSEYIHSDACKKQFISRSPRLSQIKVLDEFFK